MGNQLGGGGADTSDPLYRYRLQRSQMGLQTDSTDSNVETSSDYLSWMKTGQTGAESPAAAPPPSAGPLMTSAAPLDGPTKPTAPASGGAMAGIMAATGGGGDNFKFLGAQSGTLRPLGQRLGIQDSSVLAGRRPY